MQEPPIVITHLVCDCDGVLLDSENIALRVLGFTGVAHDRAGMAKELYEVGAEKVFDDMRDLPALVTGLLIRRAMGGRG
jgi:beta-phosphoglucomutase-like phosphatase (HAD superfamily)